jgi:hypothetical protein
MMSNAVRWHIFLYPVYKSSISRMLIGISIITDIFAFEALMNFTILNRHNYYCKVNTKNYCVTKVLDLAPITDLQTTTEKY